MSNYPLKPWLVIIAVTLCGCEVAKTRYAPDFRQPHVEGALTDNKVIYRLDLSNEGLATLPEFVRSLKTLRMLNLDNNPDLNMDQTLREICTHLNQLNTLRLNGLNLVTLPGGLSDCRALTHLSLSKNPNLDLATAMPVLARLPLEYLNLSHNNLSTLPRSIKGLNYLQDLRLSHNRLIDGPAYNYLSQLPSLYSLWLDHNQLATLPLNLGELAQIRYLFLDHNRLSTFGPHMTGMQQLRVVHLNHNNFTTLPVELTQMPSLMVVFAAGNCISRISKAFAAQRQHLNGIVLDQNCLQEQEVQRAQKLFRNYFLFSAENQRMNH